MTLTICIKASDGIVFASDSRATSRDPRQETTINDQVKKIFPVGKYSGIGIAGDGGVAMSLIDELKEKVHTENDIRKLIKEFHEYNKNIFNDWFSHEKPNERTFLSIILAGYTTDGCGEIYNLFSFDNFVPRKSATGFSCLGITYLAQYLLNRFYQQDITVKHAVDLAAFCIIETASQDGKVGGDLQISSFSSTNEYRAFTLQEIEKIKYNAKALREKMRLGFIGFVEKEYKKEEEGVEKSTEAEKKI
jgi:20S proteasome alpha/beta subunit